MGVFARECELGREFKKKVNILIPRLDCEVYKRVVWTQAFLEMNTEESAQTMVNYYSSVTPVIRNHPVFMQYSNHKELKTDNSPNQVVHHCH